MTKKNKQEITGNLIFIKSKLIKSKGIVKIQFIIYNV